MCIPIEICYETLNCVLNFVLLFCNSVSMSMTFYNLKSVVNLYEKVIILTSVILSMVIVALKQSIGLEKKIKLKKLQKIINHRENLGDIIDEIV